MMRTIERTSFEGGRIQGLIAVCVLVCVPAAGTMRVGMDVPDVTEELLHGGGIKWNGRSTTLVLGAEDVAVIRLD